MGICLIVKSGGGVDTSSATATADKILSGYTIYSNDNKTTGTMTNIGAQTESGKGVSSSTTIKAGWHDGTGKISASELKSQMAATTAATSDVLTNYTYWTNGSNSKYTGTMASRGTKEWKIGVNGSQTIESGWHSGSGTVKQSSTIATNSSKVTMNPTTSNQTLCNASTYYSQERWCAGASTLTKDNIKKDITIFGVTGTYVETKRYIIQNGALCSGVSIPFYHWSEQQDGEDGDSYWSFKNTTSSYYNVTINGSTYIRLCEYEDHGLWDEDEKMVIRGGIGSIVSLSSNDANGRLPGAICGDFACRYISSPMLSMSILLYAGSKKGDYNKVARWYLTPSGTKNSSSSWTTFTYIQTGVSASITSWFGMFTSSSSLKYGDFMIGCGSGYAPSLACKNLWIDTSKSI